MTELPTFRDWLGKREPTAPVLQEYLASLGQEWLRTELKAATEDVDFGLRRAVAALHNTRGGNVFVGVRNDRTIAGTAVSVERLRQVLAQSRIDPPNDACITDLTSAVNAFLVVQDGEVRVVVIEVIRTGKAALLIDENGAFQLCYRRGDETLEADPGKVIDWFRATRREEILVTVYRELKALSRRIRRWNYFPDLPDPALPYLASCMADGTLYRFLSDDDLLAIIGGTRDAQEGPAPGFVHTYLSTVRQAVAFYDRAGLNPSAINLEQAQQAMETGLSLGDYQTELDNRVKEFRDWLLRQGILPE